MEIYTLASEHDYDMSLKASNRSDIAYASTYAEDTEGLVAAFNCAGTCGTFGTAGGCIGTFGSFGCANCVKMK